MQFRGEYDFLSNFYTAPITYNGLTYQNNECAFQAQKTLDESKREEFTRCSPKDAKHLGRRVELRSDWEEVKYDIMKEIVKAKFEQHPELVQRLLATGDTPIVEENTWGDRTWGVCNGYGANGLGRILSDVRNEYKRKENTMSNSYTDRAMYEMQLREKFSTQQVKEIISTKLLGHLPPTEQTVLAHALFSNGNIINYHAILSDMIVNMPELQLELLKKKPSGFGGNDGDIQADMGGRVEEPEKPEVKTETESDPVIPFGNSGTMDTYNADDKPQEKPKKRDRGFER